MKKLCKLSIILPFRAIEVTNALKFLDLHSWFLDGGGTILLKSSGELERTYRKLIDKPGVILIEMPDRNIQEAWNQALDYLSTKPFDANKYVIFMGLDDLLFSDFCYAALNILGEPSPPDFIYGSYRKKLFGIEVNGLPPLKPALFGKNDYVFDVCHVGMMNKWSTISDARFNMELCLAADFDFYIGIAQAKNITYAYISLHQVLVGADGISNAANAKNIYIKEWDQISVRRKVNIKSNSYKVKALALLSRNEYIYRTFRLLYWSFMNYYQQKIIGANK